MQTVLKALGVFNWITPALHLAGEVSGTAKSMTYPVHGRFRSGAELVRELRRHGIRVHLLTRARVGNLYVFSVDPQDAERSRRVLEGRND